MDSQSGLLFVFSVAAFILLLVILLSLFYKPPRRLSVIAELSNADSTNPSVHVKVENIGKKRVKIMPPYIKFYSGIHTQVFQINPKRAHHEFPVLMKKTQSDQCDIELGVFLEKLKSQDFHATKFKVLIKNSTGLEFFSQPVDLPH